MVEICRHLIGNHTRKFCVIYMVSLVGCDDEKGDRYDQPTTWESVFFGMLDEFGNFVDEG